MRTKRTSDLHTLGTAAALLLLGAVGTGCSSALPSVTTGDGNPPGAGTSEDAGSVVGGSGSGSSSSGSGSGGSSSGSSSGGSSSGSSSGSGGSSSGSGSGGTVPDAGPPKVTPTCAPGLPGSVSDLASKSGGSTTSATTPLGVHYETPAKHVVTSAEASFLSEASQQPAIPGSTSGLHLQALTVTLYPSKGGAPTPADINQHAIGNCDGDTAFASLAYENPTFLQSLITDNHDNTFTVAMFDPTGKPMTVKLDNQFLVDGSGNIGAVSGKNGVADWGTVLEKATMKYNQVYGVVSDIGGIGSELQTPMFTGAGGSVAFDRGVLAPADLRRVVEASLAAGKLISGGFGVEGMALPNGFQTVTAHGYAVLVPPDTSTMVAMRNPWGVEPTASGYNATTDGVMNIPLDPTWSGTIDLRIIDPGAACSAGQTSPYVPQARDIHEGFVHVTERHAR